MKALIDGSLSRAPRNHTSHTEKNFFFRAISIAYKAPCPIRGFFHVSVGLEEVLHPKLLPRFICWPACVALRWYWNSGACQRLAASLRQWWRRRNNRGIAIP